MKFARVFAWLLAPLLLFAAPSALGRGGCPPDEVPMASGNCMPRDAIDCGPGYCLKGEQCLPNGCYCPPNAGCSHNEATGPVCRPGGLPCLANEACAPNGNCYTPSKEYVCGDTICGRAIKYSRGDVCAACQPGGANAPMGGKGKAAARGACPNIVGVWNSWASGLFGKSDTTFAADGSATHRSEIVGKWWCKEGTLYLVWGSQTGDYKITVSPDGSKIYNYLGALSFSR